MHRSLQHLSFSISIALGALPGAAVAGPEQSPEPAPDPDPVAAFEQPHETIVVIPADRAGPRDLTGDDPAAAAAARALDEPAFVTVVRVDDRAGEQTSVAEALARSVGVHVRSLGGLGAFSSLSVRGAPPGHTTVLVDGVPLSRVGSVSADIGRFELGAFSELELYRGGVPIEYGGATLGGALNFRSRVGPAPPGRRLRLSAGTGSFGARHLRARWLGGKDDQSRGHSLSLGYAGARGDFSYFNDNGTNLNLTDDAIVRRTNNGYDQVDGAARYRAGAGDLTFEGGGRWQWKEQGVPGTASVQSLSSSLGTVSQIVDAAVRASRLLGRDDLAAGAGAFALVERQRFLDPAGEVGLGAQDRRYLTLGTGGRAHLSWAPSPVHVIGLGLEGRFDHFAESDISSMGELPRSFGRRIGAALTAEDELRLGERARVVLLPALRIDLQRTLPIADSSAGVITPMDLEARSDAQASPRLSARVRLAPGLALKGNLGRTFRSPTALELFGDRGWVVGNPGLRPETGLSADAGAVLAPAAHFGPADRVYVETALFASRTRDTIALVPTAALVAGARNLGGALVWGGEVAASARMARTTTLTGNYTYLDSRQSGGISSYEGKRLPQRPRHQLAWRVDVARTVGGRLAVVWADATMTSGNFLDPANFEKVPPRRFLGAGLKLEPIPGLLFGVEGKNLADQRIEQIRLDPAPRPDLTRVPRAVSDFLGYPLPGRAFYLTLEWET